MATTRREFLGSAGAAVAATALLGGRGCVRPHRNAAAGAVEVDSVGRIRYGGKVVPAPVMPRPDVAFPTDRLPAPTGPKKRLALLGTLWAPRTHPHHIGAPFIEGYSVIGRNHQPHAEVVSIFLDQIHAMDIGTGYARTYRIPMFRTIEEALTLGTGKLAVDGVLMVCENGSYPRNEKGQKLWPRRAWFERIVNVFRDSGRAVPVYNDKFLASTWADSEWMYQQSRELGFPMAAGSSVPVAWRRPALAFERGIRLNGALAVGYAGLESYGYHALELLQAFVEKRPGNAGIRAVEVLSGDAAWRAARQGLWREDLLRAALARTPLDTDGMPSDLPAADPEAIVILVEYADGFRATAYLSRGLVKQFAFAADVAGRKEPVAAWAVLNHPQRDHFKFLCNHIEVLMRTGRASIPVERAYLTTGATLAAVNSHFHESRIETPHLIGLSYAPPIW